MKRTIYRALTLMPLFGLIACDNTSGWESAYQKSSNQTDSLSATGNDRQPAAQPFRGFSDPASNSVRTLPETYKREAIIPGGFQITSIQDETTHDRFYGLYDLKGKQLLPHVFERIDAFFCGRAIVKKKNGKLGVVDETGKELFYTDYDRIDRFSNGYAVVYKLQANREHAIGMIDVNGREVVPVIYQWLDQVYQFSEGIAAIAQNFKYGFVDTTGKVIIPFKYVKAESFQNGIAKVWEDWHHVGYINKKGEMVIPADFDPMDQANLRRYYQYIIGLKDSVLHVFDHSGKKVTVLNYDYIGFFNPSEKNFIVIGHQRSGVLDSNFRVQIPVVYQSLEIIFPGKIAATKNGKIGFLDPKGNIIMPFRFDWLESCHGDYIENYYGGLAIVGIKGKLGIINNQAKLITPLVYDEIREFSNGHAVVKRNNQCGFINSKGKEIIPPKYDDASSWDGHLAEVTLKGETFQIDSTGTRFEEEY